MINRRETCSFAVIFLISLLSYFNSFENSFHYDDYNYILNNEAFKEYVNHPFSIKQTLSSLSNRSVTLTSLYLNYSISDFNVFSFHILNFSVHTLTCLLIFILFKEISHFIQYSKTSLSVSKINMPFIGGLLFAVHPINTQTVTYISNRSTLLATFFYLLFLITFIRGSRSKSYLNQSLLFFLSLTSLVLGYGSKLIVITAPALLIVYCLFFPSPKLSISKKHVINKLTTGIAYCIIASPFLLIAFSKHITNLLSADIKFLPSYAATISMALSITKDYFSSAIYLLTELKVIVFYYMKMIFFPFNQNVDPDFPIANGLTDMSVLCSLFLIALFLTGGLYFQKKNRLIAFGIFWFYLTLLPTSSIIPLLDTAAEHRVYLPYIGIILIISVSLNNFFSKHNKSSRFPGVICLVSILLPLLLFSSLTIQRNFIWKDEVSLWNDAAKKSPWKPRPFNNVGEAYEKESNYQLAVENLKKAISLAPNYDYAHNNLGTVYGKLNQLDLAIKEYKHVLKVNDHFPTAHFNLGKAYEMKGVPDEAIKEYYLAIKKQHDFYQAYFNLANIYSRRKEYQKAIETYQEFLKYKASESAAYVELGKVFIKIEKIDEAFNYFSTAAKLDSNYVPAKIAIGNIFMMKGNLNKAEEIFQQVLRLDAKNFTAYNNLGLIYLQHEKDPSRAVYHFQKSLEINPSQPNAKSIMERIKKYSQ